MAKSWQPLLLVLCWFLIGHCKLRECPGTATFLDGRNIEAFQGCEHVRGNLIINDLSINNKSDFPLNYEQLSLLNDVRNISGYLFIQKLDHPQITHLRFLRHLRVIHGLETVRLFGLQDYSLLIQDNPHLITLNLASLERIENGGLRISNNPELCLVDTLSVEDYLVNSSLTRVGGLGYFCTGIHCHEQCMEVDGCWGIYADECVTCRNYKYMGTCVDACNLTVSYAHTDQNECLPLTTITSDPVTIGTSAESANSTTQRPPVLILTNSNTSTSMTSSTSNIFITSPFYARSESNIKLISIITVPSTVFVVLLVAAGVLITSCCIHRHNKKRKLSLLNAEKVPNTMSGTLPERYSHEASDLKTIIVAPAVPAIAASSGTQRRSGISINSLSSSSFQMEDKQEKEERVDLYHEDEEKFNITCPAHADHMTSSRMSKDYQILNQNHNNNNNNNNKGNNYFPLHNSPMQVDRAPSLLTRQTSPLTMRHTAATNSFASIHASPRPDTGYWSSSTSAKPSRHTSSTSLPRPMTMGGGRVAATHDRMYNQRHFQGCIEGGSQRVSMESATLDWRD